VITSCD